MEISDIISIFHEQCSKLHRENRVPRHVFISVNLLIKIHMHEAASLIPSKVPSNRLHGLPFNQVIEDDILRVVD